MNLKDAIHQFIEDLMAPPTISTLTGFVVGLVPWLKSLIIGDGAPESYTGFPPADGRRHNSLHHPYPRCKPDSRASEVGAQACGDRHNPLHPLRAPLADRHRRRPRRVRARVPVPRPAVPLRADGAVLRASRDEHRHDGSAV